MSNLTIIVQGPLNNTCLPYLDYYKTLGNVLISTWVNRGNIEDIKKLGQKYDIIASPEIEMYCFNRGNVFKQALSTLRGLNQNQSIGSDFVIKVRTDEYFSDLSYFIDSMKRNPDKLTVCNAFMRNCWRFHMSDHIVGGTYRNMLNMYGDTISRCLKVPNMPDNVMVEGKFFNLEFTPVVTEAIFFTSFLRTNGIEPEMNKDKFLLKTYQNVINVRKLGNFLINCNNYKRSFTTPEDVRKFTTDIEEVDDIR